MAMRDLITGGAACAVPGTASSSSNPFGACALANAILGSSSKTQELKGLPGTAVNVPGSSPDFRTEAPLTTIPGLENEGQQLQRPYVQNSEFLNGFRSADVGAFADAWNEVHQLPSLQTPGSEIGAQLQEFEQIYNRGVPPVWNGLPQGVLSRFLHSFVDSGRTGIPFGPATIPVLGLSQGDKLCIRDRSFIMARHIFADKSEEYINMQVNALLHSLDIDGNQTRKSPMRGSFPELEEYWTESQGALRSGMLNSSNKWASEFAHQRENGPETWVQSFEQQHGINGWASEFEQEQSQLASLGSIGANMSQITAMEQSRMLAHTLAQNNHPKFQNSKFLQFVTKMSRGELIVDDNQIRPASSSLTDWANEYQAQYNTGPSSWVDQFMNQEPPQATDVWVKEFNKEKLSHGVDDQWINEFSKLQTRDWAEEFGQQLADGTFGESIADDWANSYNKYLGDQFLASKQRSDGSRGVYVFSDMNPYVGHPNPLREGQELFRKGLLSETVLALEAEVLKNPDNSEGWRLLGITHAENDEDQQIMMLYTYKAIAAMMRAHEVDPQNLEVLLALGVSHTNELEQSEALKYLYKWLQNHPKYGVLAPPELADSLYYDDVARLFNEAGQMSPEDADIHIVLGVLYNLSRGYDKAIESFQRALKLKPRDYSLWNKLGATQANSVQSADAILAYQQALDLKPNYVRAWANMGISYAKQGLHEESIRYYVRALTMNPKADHAWQYLRIALTCAPRHDMFEACDSRNLDILQKEFPL